MKLNPRWLLSAVVHNEDGSRFGTVSGVAGDGLTVLQRGVKFAMSASALDAQDRLRKPNAADRKYVTPGR